MFRHDPAHTGVSSEKLTLPLKRIWQFKSKGRMIYSSAVVVGGAVYFGSRNDVDEPDAPPEPSPTGAGRGSLYCLDAATGALRWRFNRYEKGGIGGIVGTPAVSGGRIYFSARDGHFYCISTDGKPVWRTSTEGIYDSTSPTVVDGRAYFSSAYPNKDFFCLKASDGQLLWRRSSETTSRPGQYAYVSPPVVDGVSYFGANNAVFFALDADGKEKWRVEAPGGNPYLYAPTVRDGRIFIAPGEYNPNVYALDTATGAEVWRFPAVGGEIFYTSSPACDPRTLYIGMGNPNQIMHALDVATGRERWNAPLGLVVGESFTSSPAVAGNLVLVGTGPEKAGENAGRLLLLDAATGEVKGSEPLPQPVYASPTVSGGRVFVGAKDGVMYAWKDSSPEASFVTKPKAKSPRPKPVVKKPSPKSSKKKGGSR